jgi:hypothetical protein
MSLAAYHNPVKDLDAFLVALDHSNVDCHAIANLEVVAPFLELGPGYVVH